MVTPTSLPTAKRIDKRIQMAHWFDRVEDSPIPTPETYKLELEPDDEGMPTWDSDRGIEIVTKLGGKAFIRSDYKSAMNFRGLCIHEATQEEINTTITEHLSSMVMMSFPVVDHIYFREWLNLTWDNYVREDVHPEVRFFIRDGDVVCSHLRTAFPEDYSHSPEAAKEYFDPDKKNYPTLTENVHEYAATAADIFADDNCWYSVDFVLTTDYEWYLTDMAVDALQHHDEKGYMNISEHPGDCKHDLENMIPQQT